ncbi:hypothetical protein J6590_056188 [Homalodisca vitripennis]|nr:hypothetical protein J6590_056188 [Homalodisca vitripennis]
MTKGFQVNLDEESIDVPYRELIRSFMFLHTTSRPDITYVTSYLSQFLDQPKKEENPVFKKVPGATLVGIVNRESLVVPNDDEGTSTGRNSSASSTSKSTSSTYVRAGVKSINKYESDETKEELSLPQLQRLVLLKQLELQNLQIEKENREAEKNKGVEKSTQTDYK